MSIGVDGERDLARFMGTIYEPCDWPAVVPAPPCDFSRLERRLGLRALNYGVFALMELETTMFFGEPESFMRAEREFYYHIYYTHLMELFET